MSASTIAPLSDLDPQLLVDYLEERGFPPAVTRWKYFDDRYNRGRERGYGAVRDGRMTGFIGVIPVTLTWGERRREDHWLCDWSIADPVRDKGLGGAIVAEALKRSGRMIAFGGTEMATRRWRQKADRYDLEAAPWFRRRLTAGSFVASLQSRGFLPRGRIVDRLGGLSLGGAARPAAPVTVSPGVHPCLPALQPPGARTWRPYYDLADLQWQLEQSPGIEAWTCLSEDERAAVLLWRSEARSGLWKLAPIASAGAPTAVSTCIAGALRHIGGLRGSEVLAMVSRLDGELAAALASNAFRRTKTVHPIFFMDTDAEAAPHCLEGASFLDTDEGHRF